MRSEVEAKEAEMCELVVRRGEAGWDEYAPHDLGSARANLLALVRGTRTCGGEGSRSKAV